MSVSEQLYQWQKAGTRVWETLARRPLSTLFGRPEPLLSRGRVHEPGRLSRPSNAASTCITLWHFGPEGLQRHDNVSLETLQATQALGGRRWIDVCGFSDLDTIRALGEHLDLHALTLADLVNVERQTKAEDLDERTLIVMQLPHLAGAGGDTPLSQIGWLISADLLLTFREHPGDLFDSVLARMDRPSSRLRSKPLDYLACALLDVAMETGFPVVERLAEQLDDIEEAVMNGQGQDVLGQIHAQRRALITLGRLFWRQRDLMARLLRDESHFHKTTRIYLRDAYDQAVQLLDMTETTRELAASLLEIHLSISANRTNQVMKTLTIMASIFIPLTFVAGVYGMNFEHMPELAWPWAYPAILGVMLAIAIGLLWWFRRRGWLGHSP
ncbi:MAG: magnesium/cobalt transporter CorA [Wenzhouxiangella sp.]